MRRSMRILVLAVAGAAVSWAALAVDCRYQDVRVDVKSFAFIDTWPDYDVCWEFSKTVGTLNGRYVCCIIAGENRSSDDIWGDGIDTVDTTPYYCTFETSEGTVETREWAWFDGDFGIESGMAKVVGGTGAFEGAFGSLSFAPKWPNPNLVFLYRGYVCTP